MEGLHRNTGLPSSWMMVILLCALTDCVMTTGEIVSTTSSVEVAGESVENGDSNLFLQSSTPSENISFSNVTSAIVSTTPKSKKKKSGSDLMMTIVIIAVVCVLAAIIAVSSFLSKKTTKKKDDDDQPMHCPEYYLGDGSFTDISRVVEVNQEGEEEEYKTAGEYNQYTMSPTANPLFMDIPDDEAEAIDSLSNHGEVGRNGNPVANNGSTLSKTGIAPSSNESSLSNNGNSMSSIEKPVDNTGNAEGNNEFILSITEGEIEQHSASESVQCDTTEPEQKENELGRAVPRLTLGQGMYGAIDEEEEEETPRTPREGSLSPASDSSPTGGSGEGAENNTSKIVSPPKSNVFKTKAEVILNPQTIQQDVALV